MFTVDGVTWGWPCDIERAAEMTPSQISGLMLDGSTRVDELATLAVITHPCMPLTEGQLRDLLSLVLPFSTHTLNYYDPSSGQRTIRVRRSVSQPKYRGRGADGNLYWTGITLTFREI